MNILERQAMRYEKGGMNYELGYHLLGRIAENEEKNGPNLGRAF
jgi:hypothetical protein